MDLRNKKLEEAKEILTSLGMDAARTNDRSAWVLLALCAVTPDSVWGEARAPLLTTNEIMDFIRRCYGKDYKPNSRETIRRQTLHQFEQAGLILRNRDDRERPTNSQYNNYSLNQPVIDLLRRYPSDDWAELVKVCLGQLTKLIQQSKRNLKKSQIPITLPNGSVIKLSPGAHNQLHADIIHKFCPEFIGEGGRVLYIGDTASSRGNEGGKLMVLETEYLEQLGIPPMSHDKLPDIVVYDEKRNWLFLIEAVTTHGPVSELRWSHLQGMLSNCNAGPVYVSAFPDRKVFRKHVADIAWETEVWIADNPAHMIHFNGDRFLGPH
ncbi:MAG: restriction endonuclease [Acinetobacter sp.]|uniref:BsuBI/PstI family type II restriction endonuclease n=1 Tax=Acinetobacter sp. TaxID=472 RepID=UPI000C5880AB|nr:BsuBI/PstI family type II restriction endonuclease [Acinetobacter sp.]MBT48646.1 restriction endonuclease [Acinetobacter sp.]MBT48658.1 restriction endonuclease [Acinetobacter sp.]|tara:strand:+ start:10924 stop:11892 length:969 start_codon:yes stop_codon:yes gene_type:complete